MPRKPDLEPKRLCGAAVMRCNTCDKAVAKSKVRNGQGCPAHPDAGTKPGTCTNRLKPGAVRCHNHGGNAPQAEAGVRRRLEAAEAWGEVTRLGVAIRVGDGDALVAMRDEAAGNVDALRHLVHSLGLDRIYADTYHPNGSPTGEAKPHIIWAMYAEERDRAAKLDECCVKLKLAERRVRIEELQAEVLFRAVDGAAKVLPPEMAAMFRQALADQLRTLTAG